MAMLPLSVLLMQGHCGLPEDERGAQKLPSPSLGIFCCMQKKTLFSWHCRAQCLWLHCPVSPTQPPREKWKAHPSLRWCVYLHTKSHTCIHQRKKLPEVGIHEGFTPFPFLLINFIHRRVILAKKLAVMFKGRRDDETQGKRGYC